SFGVPGRVLVDQLKICQHVFLEEPLLFPRLLNKPGGAVLDPNESRQNSAIQKDESFHDHRVKLIPDLMHIITVTRAARRIEILRVVYAIGEKNNTEDRVIRFILNRS